MEKRGTSIIKRDMIISDTELRRSKWYIDENIPIFKGADRGYVNNTFMIGDSCNVDKEPYCYEFRE